MEAGNQKKKKKKEKRSAKRKAEAKESDSESMMSDAPNNISFVLERNNGGLNRSNGSIFGESAGSGHSTSSKPAKGRNSAGMFSLGLLMVICCVSSQIMVEGEGVQGTGMHNTARHLETESSQGAGFAAPEPSSAKVMANKVSLLDLLLNSLAPFFAVLSY